MQPSDEGYHCARVTVEDDYYIRGFRPTAPLGTHHTALAIDLAGGNDGSFPCEASDTGFKLLFGSGVGTEPYLLPEGVAFKLEAGTQVILNLHLYNTTDTPLSGESGIEIERIAVEDVVHEAETIYALDFDLQVPPGQSTHSGKCTVDGDSTLVGVFPHMHTLGTHMSAAAVRGGGEPAVFFDEPYSFEAQLNYALAAPVELADGDEIHYTCGFANPGTETIEFGDSTDAEMCVLGV
jgi:hypothetical protein